MKTEFWKCKTCKKIFGAPYNPIFAAIRQTKKIVGKVTMRKSPCCKKDSILIKVKTKKRGAK